MYVGMRGGEGEGAREKKGRKEKGCEKRKRRTGGGREKPSRLKRSGPSARKQIKSPNHSSSADTLHQLGSSANQKAAAFAGVIFLIHSFREVLLVLVDFFYYYFFFGLFCCCFSNLYC